MGMPGLTPAGLFLCLKLGAGGWVQGVRACREGLWGLTEESCYLARFGFKKVDNEPGVVWPVDIYWGLL